MRVGIYNHTTVKGRRQYRRANKDSEGPFYLRYVKHGVRKWHSCGPINYTGALAQARRIEAMWFDESENPQPKVTVAPEEESLLADAIQKYLHNIAVLKSLKTANGYSARWSSSRQPVSRPSCGM